MIAVVLAGGLSKRLHPITLNEPKCLLTFEGQTMLNRYLCLLEKVGVSKTLIITGFNHDAVVREINLSKRQMQVDTLLNTDFNKEENHPIHGFLLSRDYVEDDFLLLNSDIYFSENTLDKLVKSPRSCVAIDASLPFIEKEMFVNFDDDFRVTEISKTLKYREKNQGKSIQVVKFLREDKDTIFDRAEVLSKEKDIFYPAQAYDTLIEQEKFFAVDIAGEFSHELDTVEDYHSLMSHIEKKK